jgi:hypothetical protein
LPSGHPEFADTYQCITKRRGKKIATVAVTRKLLTRAYHLLAVDAGTPRDVASSMTTENTNVRGSHDAGSSTDREGHQAPGALGPSGMNRPPAALDHLTEQPGSRTHGHGAMPIRRDAEWVLARPLRPDHTPSEDTTLT